MPRVESIIIFSRIGIGEIILVAWTEHLCRKYQYFIRNMSLICHYYYNNI